MELLQQKIFIPFQRYRNRPVSVYRSWSYLFTVAGLIAGLFTANKRAAITDFVVLIAPIFMALLLVQILDSHSKIKLLLVVIAALGVVSAYQCAEQFFSSNQMTIDQYEQTPEAMLEPLGIQSGSFQHMLFEHRLYSRGVRGFFTTGNSAGSFSIMASFAAIALFLEKLKNRKSDTSGPGPLLGCGIAVTAVIFGLAITRSKGAIAASLIAAVMFVAFLRFGNRLKTHRKTILIVCLLLAVAVGGLVVYYGLTHGRLPGGNSMLVRWQYWNASARMYADHPFTGVGPGNFANFYPHYKPAEALETVSDPHNFPLTILTQYGPLGLVGFLAMILLPLWRTISHSPATASTKAHVPEAAFRKLAIPFAIIISVCLLLIRPMIMPAIPADNPDVMIYVILILYVAPVIAFIVGFWLLSRNSEAGSLPLQVVSRGQESVFRFALFCAVAGVLIHNTIDFAIFEPGVLTTFWAVIACLIALRKNGTVPDVENCPSFSSQRQFVLKTPAITKITVAAAALALTCIYFNYALIPVAKSTAKIKLAHKAISYGRLEQACNLFSAAAKDDSLSPAALFLNSRTYLQEFFRTEPKQKKSLLRSEKCLLGAIERNQADFKNFERLTEVYTLLAENSKQQVKTNWLNKAFDSIKYAVERYPGCGRLRIKLAKIAEQLGKTDTAIEQYKKAIEIEDSFRVQFRIMYPDREIFSRLGEEKYQSAKQRIKFLSERPTP
jgi:O-antigen ligase